MRFFSLFAAFIAIGLAIPAGASERAMFVQGDRLNVRLCASSKCCVTRQLKANEIVSVYEIKGAWSRISRVYEKGRGPSCTGKKGDEIAEWVSSRYLSHTPPTGYGADQWYGALGDRRIRGIPKVGDYGLTWSDIEIIRRYAAQMLAADECSAVETGNKSVSRPGTYYIYCSGDSGQRFFTEADLEN